MKKTLPLLLLLTHFTVFGQEIRNITFISQDTTVGAVSSIAYWSKNESRTYEVRVEKNIFNGDSLTNSKINTHALYDISVIDSTADSYQVKWKYLENLKETKVDFNSLELDEDLLMEIVMQELSVSYKTDELGAFEEFNDNSAINELVTKITQKMVDKIADTIPENKKENFKTVINRILTPEYIWNKAFGENIQLFHYFHGFGCGINDTIRFEESLQIPSFKTQLDLESYVYVSSNDPDNFECQFSFNKYGDGKEILNLGLEILDGVIPKEEKQNLETNDENHYDFQIISNHYINTNTGWPNYIELYREVVYQLKDKTPITHQDAIFIYPHEE